jgi:hypothetical protein
MPPVGFEPTIPAFQRTKTVHASDRTAIEICGIDLSSQNSTENKFEGIEVR